MRLIPGKSIMLAGLVALLLIMVACSPAAAPTPTPIPKVPASTAVPAKTPAASTPAASAAATPSPTPKPATLKFGTIPSAAYAGFYVANDKGYFKEQGITMETVSFTSVADLIAPAGTGQVDVIALPVSSPLLAAGDRGVDLKIVASSSQSLPNYEHAWVLLRKDLKDSGKINSLADLKGQKIAIPSPGSMGEQTVQMAMEQAGLKPTDLEVIVLPFADQATALGNGALAATHAMEPNIALSIQRGIAVKWIPSSPLFGGKVQSTVIVFGPTMLKDKDLAQRWMVAYLKGSRDYIKSLTTAEGRQAVAQILAKYTPVKDLSVYNDMEMPFAEPNGTLDKKSMDVIYKWLAAKGLYTGKKTPDDMTDLSYLDYAVQKLGKQ